LCSGDFVKDTWSSKEIGTIPKDFLVIEKQDTFYRNDYDGITGLAYKALGKPKDAPKPSFYDALITAKSGTPDAFGMLLCGIMQPMLTQSNYSMHSGQLVVGGTEGLQGETFYSGPILYTPIVQEAWYVVIITDIGFDGKSLGLPCASYNQPQVRFPPTILVAYYRRV
jgi:beta-site APP-cleaving enzyme 2 (memapsin 1)